MRPTICQDVRMRGASFVDEVSPSHGVLSRPPTSCDWSACRQTFYVKKSKRNKFDVIADLAEGGFGRLEECVTGGEIFIVNLGSTVDVRFITTFLKFKANLWNSHSVRETLKVFLAVKFLEASRTCYRSDAYKIHLCTCLSNNCVQATTVAGSVERQKKDRYRLRQKVFVLLFRFKKVITHMAVNVRVAEAQLLSNKDPKIKAPVPILHVLSPHDCSK